jgi:ATP-dependent protease HslVU (ClpYQ) peptidase subunit
MNKIKSSKSFTKLKKNKKRNIVLASLLCGTALAGASIGVSCATNPVPPTPSVYNYVEFAEVETFFAVTGNQLVGFAGTTADQKLASKEGLIDFMEDHPEYNGIDFGNRFASVANSAFTYDEDYNDLKLPECVKAIKFSNDVSINDHAFYICTGLEKVVFGDGNVSIGDGAFVRNASLEEIVFGDGTISIGSTSFGECIKLSKITVDSNAVITSIGENAFSYCLSLRNRDQITITNKNLMGVGH